MHTITSNHFNNIYSNIRFKNIVNSTTVQQLESLKKCLFSAFANVYCNATVNFTISKCWDGWKGFLHHLSAQELVVLYVDVVWDDICTKSEFSEVV